MSVFVIGDLHLSFNQNKPMDIFGDKWKNHTEKIKENWLKKVKPEDTVLLLGDFSWEMKLQDTVKDFEYINLLPGRKILLKGNHDYWWTTVTNIKKFLDDNSMKNIDLLYNNSFNIENKIYCGAKGWTINNFEQEEENEKMCIRENNRLKISIENGIENFGKDKEFIACMHYPPITKNDIENSRSTMFMETLKQYNIKKCYYGHLHGEQIKNAVEGIVDGIELKLISADAIDFELVQIL